ncbi:MAG: hypothetical protein IK025_01610 [Bacteroidales bacterium]|nr:hypothetical protein [Bacteroidales bacterium]
MYIKGFRRLMVFIIVCVSASNLFSAELEFSGIFYEQNAYIKNPAMQSGFSIKGITLNGKAVDANLNTGLVVIDFSKNGLKSGDTFTAIIRYDEPELPIIINRKAFASASTFELVSAKIEMENGSTNLYLTIKDETSPMPFYIDHLRANKWVRIGAIIGKGGKDEKQYVLPMTSLPGENKLKIYQINNDETQRCREFTAESPQKNAVELKKIVQNKKMKEIIFTGTTEYIIVDKEYGNTKMRGTGSNVDISPLPKKKKYFVTYEEKFKKFKRKRK